MSGIMSHPQVREDAVLPVQFFAPSQPDAGERRLLLAIFEGAISDATAYPVTGHTDEARSWLASPAMTPFSAAWIADYLGLHLGAVRTAVADRTPIRIGNRVNTRPRRVNGRPAKRGGFARNRWTVGNLV